MDTSAHAQSRSRRERDSSAPFSWLVPVALFVGIGALCCPPPAAAEDPALTPEEQGALRSGELVTRPLRVQRGSLELVGGLSWQMIEAPSETVWRTLLDVGDYPSLLPAAVEARVVETRETTREVFIRHAAWPFHASYFVLIDSDAETRTLSFRLNTDRPSGLRAGWGFARVTSIGQRTCLAFGILADVGAGMLGVVAQPLIQPWMLRVPQQVKTFVERGRRQRRSP